MGNRIFSEIKNVMGHILARKRTGSWDIQSEQPGEENHICHPGIDGAFLYNECGEKDVSCFERIAIDKKGGKKVKQEKFLDRCRVHKKVFAVSGLVVVSSLESS